MAIMERGPTGHTNGTYNGMAIHALNALSGCLFAEGGMFYQMGPPYGPLPVNCRRLHGRLRERRSGSKQPRIDKAGTENGRWPAP
jgi:thiosulfate reductase / polysulfide reductase chain A